MQSTVSFFVIQCCLYFIARYFHMSVIFKLLRETAKKQNVVDDTLAHREKINHVDFGGKQ